MFKTPFLVTLPSLNHFTDLNKLCNKSCGLFCTLKPEFENVAPDRQKLFIDNLSNYMFRVCCGGQISKLRSRIINSRIIKISLRGLRLGSVQKRLSNCLLTLFPQTLPCLTRSTDCYQQIHVRKYTSVV